MRRLPQGHEATTSDLSEMGFNPVSGRHYFISVKDPFYFKQQIEELHATDNHGFAAEVEGNEAKPILISCGQ